MTLQFRPKGAAPSDPFYAPDRDLAYIWPHLTKVALDQLARDNWKPWFADYFRYAGVTEADVADAGLAYARFFQHLCGPAGATDPREAFVRAGWFDLKPGAQVAMFMKMGQVVTMAYFTAVRDVTPDNGAPPADLDALVAAAAAARVACSLPGPFERARLAIERLACRLRRFLGSAPPAAPPGPPPPPR
jgi:hypothetical protein